ncbi:hypothetical protein SISSUDRAFT_9702 [Sistotremastrum suecicum HHB10207 ss-3]|uniref:Uncharacterized protein n=1 Tax=Sistotremastrum suecicum HHB10207 ss-3 TaxID=1314776 RepID=A0A166J434_9AGAM|nr:hypothetical protein SISSUDRAFT_9702 [Sistotremastrum suecicum HHB10207 ss-3]
MPRQLSGNDVLPTSVRSKKQLEEVVMQLQDSWRDARDEAVQLRQEKNQLSALAEKLKQQLKDRDMDWRNAWQAQLGNVPFPVATPVNSTPSTFAFNMPSFNNNELSTSDERRHRPSSSPNYHPTSSNQTNLWQGAPTLPSARTNFEQRPEENYALSSHTGFRDHIDHSGHYMNRSSTSNVLPQIDATGQYMPSRSLSPTSSLSSPLTSASTSATHLHYYSDMPHSASGAEIKNLFCHRRQYLQ